MARPLTRTGSATSGILAFILGGSLAVGALASFRPAPEATDDAPASTALELSADAVRNLGVGEQTQMNNVALPEGPQVNLRLERFEVLAPNAEVVVAGVDGERPLDVSGLALLRGHVVGDPESRVFVSLSDHGVQGFISTAGSVYSLSSGLAVDGFGRPEDLRITKVEGPIAGLNMPPVTCGVVPGDPELHPNGFERPVEADQVEEIGRGEPPCRVARLAIDTDWEYSELLFGGDTDAAAAYALTLVAGVGEIYQSNVNVQFTVSYLRVWETNSDAYNQGDDLLQEFRNHWNATQGGVERDLAHLLSGRSDLPYGGVAYLSVVCSPNFGYGLSGYLNGSFPYPLINNNGGNWDLVVLAHELGHNFGTGHTHDSYNPPIDNCGNGDCTGAGDGTIMSYCHTCPGGISNITLNFHPLVRNQILSYLNSACDLTANGTTAVNDQAATLPDEPILIDVLLNDQAASCDAVDLVGADAVSAEGGEVEVVVNLGGNGRDMIRYTPPTGYAGADSFSYTINGGAVATVDVDVLSLRQPDEPGATTPGVGVEYYALANPSVLPDFSTLDSYASDDFPSINFPSTNGNFATSGRNDDVGAVFTGFVEVPAGGMYTFFTESDDGSRLYIGDEMIVDNDGLHAMQERSGEIALGAGKHSIRVEFFERGGGAGIIVRFQGPNISKRVIEQSRWSQAVDCPADVTGDGSVDLADLNLVLANFGQTTDAGDANGDGVVDLTDLNAILGVFGSTCE